MERNDFIIGHSDPILITGSNGFIGTRVVKTLLDRGFTDLRCLVRATSDVTALRRVLSGSGTPTVRVVPGDLGSREDCIRLTTGVRVVYHLAASIRDTSFASSYRNNVETTENLLKALARHKSLRRFVLVARSSYIPTGNSSAAHCSTKAATGSPTRLPGQTPTATPRSNRKTSWPDIARNTAYRT